MFEFNDHHAKTDCKGQKVGNRSCIKYAHNAEKCGSATISGSRNRICLVRERKVPLYAFPMELKTSRRSAAKSLTR